ncbi:MAG TPA: glycosyl hydrolase [Puia sp.]|uniref:glycosyl hydrolase n=1 Tax=Puia sp. TaxID=2045100 RepID=UPI002C7EF13A|nr:glycosyl hydrolase [Puia sp.]HVU93630.1 glycosyl hydrolase [Puia sp.]
MTRYLLPSALVLILLLGSCKKDSTPSQEGGGTDTTGTNPSSPATSSKKGVDFNVYAQYGNFETNVVNLKAFWYYTWGTLVPLPSPKNCEFVSMFWGPGNMTDANISATRQSKAQGTVKNIIAFNEPDRQDQSNMTVSQALAYWPKLEGLGLPLGSPATSWPTLQWFYDFMDSAIAEKRRVDFICVHMYVGTDDNAFVQTLQTVYDKYHLPIWITEFATADWNATSASANQYSPADVLGFMQRLLPRLDALPYVQRYSWFSGSPTDPTLWSSALIGADGKLTTLGQWYSNYQPNTAIKP